MSDLQVVLAAACDAACALRNDTLDRVRDGTARPRSSHLARASRDSPSSKQRAPINVLIGDSSKRLATFVRSLQRAKRLPTLQS